MIVIKRDNPQIFGGKAFLMSKEESIAINAIADAISVNRLELIQLLVKHGYFANDGLTKEELLKQLSEAFKNKQFANDFAKQYAKKYSSKYSNYDEDDSDSDSEKKSTWGTGANMPYISAIVNGVGGILGIFSKQDNTGAQLSYNQQILMLAAEKEAQKKRNQTIAIISVIIVVLGIAGFTFYYAKKNKAI